MFSKNVWYFLHTILILTCVTSFAVLGYFGIVACVIGYYINEHLRTRCQGFYYERREHFGVDIIDTDWEPTEE